MASDSGLKTSQKNELASNTEINSWRRGFTPQAEIWNGRMAMLGLVIGMTALLFINFLSQLK